MPRPRWYGYIEWFGGIVRVGPECHKPGDPYEWAAGVNMRRFDSAEVQGVWAMPSDQANARLAVRAAREAGRQQGVKFQINTRVRNGKKRVTRTNLTK